MSASMDWADPRLPEAGLYIESKEILDGAAPT